MLSLILAIAATGVHLWAGWDDEHRIVLQPGGHMTVFAAMAWLGTLLFAAPVVMFSRLGRGLGCFAFGLSILGLLLLAVR